MLQSWPNHGPNHGPIMKNQLCGFKCFVVVGCVVLFFFGCVLCGGLFVVVVGSATIGP
jgi:hypothetical protein